MKQCLLREIGGILGFQTQSSPETDKKRAKSSVKLAPDRLILRVMKILKQGG